jgi:hypothetical protein
VPSARCGEIRVERDVAENGATGTDAAVRAWAAVNVETFRRAEIKHDVRLKSFHAMRNLHVMRSFHAKSAGTVRTCPARPHSSTAGMRNDRAEDSRRDPRLLTAEQPGGRYAT